MGFSKESARVEFCLLRHWENMISHLTNKKAIEMAREHLAEKKKELRKRLKYDGGSADRHIIKDYGIDGFVELVELPESLETQKDAERYFESKEYIRMLYAAYDCTGQAFTSWYKVFKRRDRYMAYHSVCFDC